MYLIQVTSGIDNIHKSFCFIFCRLFTVVQASDVIVTGTMDGDGGLQIQFYVQGMRDVISQQVVINAITVG